MWVSGNKAEVGYSALGEPHVQERVRNTCYYDNKYTIILGCEDGEQ